jgi:hypothetical protein
LLARLSEARYLAPEQGELRPQCEVQPLESKRYRQQQPEALFFVEE